MNDINNKPGRLCFEVQLTSAKGTPMSELCFEVKFFVYGHPKAVLFTRETLTNVEGRYYALMDERTFVDGNLFCEAYVKDVVMRVNTGYVIGGHCACGQATTDTSGGYTLSVNRVEKPSSSATAEIIAEELHGEKMHLPELLADRAVADEAGNRITDTYVTRHGLTNHIKSTYNEQFLENPPLITDGYITPAMLSEDTKNLLEAAGTEVTNLPDGEDLESVHGVLKLANKEYNPNSYDGLGRQYVRRNVVNGVNTLVQSMMKWSNTLYIIRYDHDLQGRTITIPEGCTLMIESGKLYNGKVVLNDTQVRPYGCLLKDYIDCEIEGTFRKGQVLYSEEYKQTVVWTGEKWKCSYSVLFRVNENKLQQSVDDGETWEDVSDYIASYFRFVASSGQNSVGKIQISQNNKTWTDLSPEFTNYMRIADYVATTAELPKNAPQGIIYGVGPVDGSTYTLYVNTSKGWINNGSFASFTAGVVQETGDNENAVMSQKAVTEKFDEHEVKLAELGSEVETFNIPLTEGGYYNANGVFSTNEMFSYSDFVKVVEGDVIKYRGYAGNDGVGAILAYDKNKTFIKAILVGELYVQKAEIITISEGIEYVRFSIANENHSLFASSKVSLVVSVKELCRTSDLKKEIADVKSDVGLSIVLKYEGYYDVDGIYHWSETFSNSNYVGVAEFEQIIIGGWSGNDSVSNVSAYDENKVFISALSVGNGAKEGEKVDIPSGVSYVIVSMANEKHQSYTPLKVRHILLSNSICRRKEIEEVDENIREEIDDVKSNIGDNMFPIDARLDGNTLFSASGWYSFQDSRLSVVDDYVNVLVDTGISDMPHIGIRNDNILTKLVNGNTYILSLKLKAVDNIEAVKLWLSSTYSERIPISENWSEYSYSFVYDSNSITRIQFSRDSIPLVTNECFAVKDVCIYNENSIVGQIGKVNQEIDKLKGGDGVSSLLKGKKIAVIGDSISTIYNNNTPYWKVLGIDVGKEIQSYVTWFDVYSDASGNNPTNKTIGGVTLTNSMVGQLITFMPNSEDVGKEIGVPLNYNSASTKVWSQQLCEETGAILIANASWSGSRITTHGTDRHYLLSESWSDHTIHRCQKRIDNGMYETPDIIIIYKGTNDFSHSPYAKIDDVSIMDGIPQTDYIDNSYQFRAGYYLTINKLREAYPKAIIYCATLNVFKRVVYDKFPTRNGLYTLPQMNNVIRDIANTMGCGLIEFDKDGITFENCYSQGYITDSSTIPTHPNTKGHEVMARKAASDLSHTL